MSFYKIKIRPCDKLFSLFIRTRDKWTCQRCGKVHDKSSRNFGVSHFYSRRKESVRYEPDNSISLCSIPCHEEWEHEKKEGRDYYKYMVERLGIRAFAMLTVRAYTIGKRDDELTMLRLKELMKIEEI